MNVTRRGLLSILAASFAPAAVSSQILMPVRQIWQDDDALVLLKDKSWRHVKIEDGNWMNLRTADGLPFYKPEFIPGYEHTYSYSIGAETFSKTYTVPERWIDSPNRGNVYFPEHVRLLGAGLRKT